LGDSILFVRHIADVLDFHDQREQIGVWRGLISMTPVVV
jgi:hypothetical protein